MNKKNKVEKAVERTVCSGRDDREGDTDPDTCTGGHTIKGYW